MKLLLTTCLLLAVAQALPYGDDNNDIYSNDDYEDDKGREETVIHMIPQFVSQPKNDLVNEGGAITLPCVVDRLEGFVLLWKKGEDIITVGNQVIIKQDRFSLEQVPNGNQLVIALAEEDDAGNYTCQISTYKPTEITHSIKIRVKPQVEPVPPSGVIVAQTGDTVTLGCRLTKGSPTPEVKWHRRERKMPSGEDFLRGLSITYTAVTRHHSGNYICQADNGFGEPTETLLKLDVQHAPEIEQEETFIHTGEGDETEVICIVHASPKAEVTWFKDGQVITQGPNVINQRGNRHTLLIPGVSEEAFGDYTCKAENSFGKAEKTAKVSGLSGPVTIKSDPKGPSYDRYTLEWTVQSTSPVTHFRVQYKPKHSSGPWTTKEVNSANLDREFYTGDFTMTGLSPATVYIARVATKNSYGYNDYGEQFQFATKGADPVQKPITGSSSTLTSSSVLLSLCIFTMARNMH